MTKHYAKKQACVCVCVIMSWIMFPYMYVHLTCRNTLIESTHIYVHLLCIARFNERMDSLFI